MLYGTILVGLPFARVSSSTIILRMIRISGFCAMSCNIVGRLRKRRLSRPGTATSGPSSVLLRLASMASTLSRRTSWLWR
ncbi:hypothetical protein GGG16DRAFT_95114, partial [Schizophyllum commune]